MVSPSWKTPRRMILYACGLSRWRKKRCSLKVKWLTEPREREHRHHFSTTRNAHGRKGKHTTERRATRHTPYLLPLLPPLSLSSSGIGSLSQNVNLMEAPFSSFQSAALHYEATMFVRRQNLFPLEHKLRGRLCNVQDYFLLPSLSKDKIYASRSGSRTSVRNDCAGAVIPSFSSSGRSS